MTLSDPVPALAERSSLIGYLMGTVALGHLVETLARDRRRPCAPPPDDFVHLLLGVASLGKAVERLATMDAPDTPAWPVGSPEPARWLR